MTTLPKIFCQIVDKCFAQRSVRNWWKKFWRKHFSSQISFGHEECTFGNPAEKCSPERREFFNASPQMVKRTFPKRTVFAQSALLNLWNAFSKPLVEIDCPEAAEFLLSVRMWLKWHSFSSRITFPQEICLDTSNAVLKASTENCRKKDQIFWLNERNWKTILELFVEGFPGYLKNIFDNVILKFSIQSWKKF